MITINSKIKMEKIGTEIRVERKKRGLTLEQFAKKVGISIVTLHRIETGKSSPSVVLLSEIAHKLNKSIYSFIKEKRNPELPIHLKLKNQRPISTQALKIKVIGPKEMIGENIILNYGELNKGSSIDPHTNPGKEFSYTIEGKCQFKQNNQTILIKKGDSIFFNGRIEHSITAIEKLKFFSIYIKDKK
jgi:transcriptional regulator with XRE-family HTH domain